MKVYVLLGMYNDGDDSDIAGVYVSNELAQCAVKELKADDTYFSHSIEAFELQGYLSPATQLNHRKRSG